MPRPLLEIWRKLNLGHDREPSSLLQQAIAKEERELSSPAARQSQLLARLSRPTVSPLQQAIAAAAVPRPLSPTQRAIADLIRQENDIAGRVLGTPRPVAPAPPPPPKRKRKPSHPTSLTPAEIERAAAIVRGRPGMSLTDVWKTLDAEGIRASKSTIYRLVFKRARGRP